MQICFTRSYPTTPDTWSRPGARDAIFDLLQGSRKRVWEVKASHFRTASVSRYPSWDTLQRINPICIASLAINSKHVAKISIRDEADGSDRKRWFPQPPSWQDDIT